MGIIWREDKGLSVIVHGDHHMTSREDVGDSLGVSSDLRRNEGWGADVHFENMSLFGSYPEKSGLLTKRARVPECETSGFF